jgi:hypothetical protein
MQHGIFIAKEESIDMRPLLMQINYKSSFSKGNRSFYKQPDSINYAVEKTLSYP